MKEKKFLLRAAAPIWSAQLIGKISFAIVESFCKLFIKSCLCLSWCDIFKPRQNLILNATENVKKKYTYIAHDFLFLSTSLGEGNIIFYFSNKEENCHVWKESL